MMEAAGAIKAPMDQQGLITDFMKQIFQIIAREVPEHTIAVYHLIIIINGIFDIRLRFAVPAIVQHPAPHRRPCKK